MANFARIRPSGFWTINSVFLPAEAEDFDAVRPKLANFTDGSTHAPSAFVIVGGAGFQLDGTGHELAATGRLTVQSGAELRVASGGTQAIKNGGSIAVESGGALDLYGSCTLKTAGPGLLTVESGCTATIASGGTLTAAGSSTTNLSGATLVRGAMTIKSSGGPGSLTVESGCTQTVAGQLSGSGSAAIVGAFVQQAILTHDSVGRIKWRYRTLSDASQTISLATDTIVKISNSCAANRTISVSTVVGTPQNGDWMYVYRSTPQSGSITDSGLYSVQLESDSGDVLFIFSPASDKQRAGVLIVFNETAGDWEPIFWNNLGGTGTGLFGV